MQRTLSLKVDLPEEFSLYLEKCADIFNSYVSWSFEKKTYNKAKAHQELYHLFRDKYPEMPSAIIQSIRDTALENIKALKFKFRPFKKATSHVRYDKRTISLKNNNLSIGWSGNRIKRIIKLPKFFSDRYGSWKFQAATIGYDSLKKCFKVNLIFESKTPEKMGSRSIGIDRGLYNIVTLSDGFRYASKQIRKVKRSNLFLKKQLQTKGTRSAKRKLKSLSGYEKRFSLDINHKITKQLVNMPYDIFVLEDLTGIRKQKSKGKIINKWLSDWSFWQLEQLLTYKAEALGKTVIKVDARYTSQKCSNCGKIDKCNRKGSHYKCNVCGYRGHADVNAARNIRNNFLSAAVKIQKAEQAECQSAKCLECLEASQQPCAGGN
jgi:putative transposase